MQIVKHSIILFILLFTSFQSNVYAEGSGIRINYNKLKIYVEYNDNAYDTITGMNYVREPSKLLFDLLTLIQKNKKALSDSKLDIFVSVGNNNNYLLISQRKPSYKKHLLLENIKHLDKKILLTTLCKVLSIENCNTGDKKSKTWFYISDSNVSGKSADLIEFGCFPCNNIINYTLTPRFQSSDPNVPTPKFKKVTVDRQTIYHYFNKLIE